MNTKIKSNAFLLLAAMIWGFAFVAQVESAGRIGGVTYSGVRYLLGACSLIPVILLFEREKLTAETLKAYAKSGFFCGCALFIATNLQQIGIVYMKSAGKAGFITGLYTVLVPILSFFLFRKKSGWNIWLGAFLAVGGLALLCLPGNTASGISQSADRLGFCLVLASAFFWAMHILLIDRLACDLSPIKFSAVQFAVCSVLSLITASLFEIESLPSLWSQIVDARYPILYGGLLSVGVAYTCQVIGQRGADPTAAAIILSTESVFSSLGEMVFYLWLVKAPDYKPMSLLAWLGCALMFAGIVVSQVSFSRPKRESK